VVIAAILTVACWLGQPQAEAGPARGSGHPRAVWSTLAKPEVQSWLRRYNGSANGDDQAAAVGVSPDGSMVFVGGTVEGATSSFDYGIVAYRAATGVQVWGRRLNDPTNGADWATAIAVSPDGSRVYLTGFTQQGDTTVAYAAATGGQLWVRTYADCDGSPAAMRLAPDGTKLFITGYCYGPSGNDYVTLAYDTETAARLWVSTYNGPG